jgi:hypothetical protein
MPILRTLDDPDADPPTGLVRVPERVPLPPELADGHHAARLLDISTSIDHIHAVSTGGDWKDTANLATACARCQYQKSNLPLEVLGWPIRASDVDADWDGLTDLYDTLWQSLGRPNENEHAVWTRAFAAAHE